MNLRWAFSSIWWPPVTATSTSPSSAGDSAAAATTPSSPRTPISTHHRRRRHADAWTWPATPTGRPSPSSPPAMNAEVAIRHPDRDRHHRRPERRVRRRLQRAAAHPRQQPDRVQLRPHGADRDAGHLPGADRHQLHQVGERRVHGGGRRRERQAQRRQGPLRPRPWTGHHLHSADCPDRARLALRSGGGERHPAPVSRRFDGQGHRPLGRHHHAHRHRRRQPADGAGHHQLQQLQPGAGRRPAAHRHGHQRSRHPRARG